MTAKSTIRTAARAELQETTAGFWADSEFNTWFDDANAQIVVATRQEAIATATLVRGTESYSLPADFYLARRVEMQTTAGSVTNWTVLQPMSIDARRSGDPLDTTTQTSPPTGWYIFNGSIYFNPIPDQAYSATVYYYKNATVSTLDADTPSYPEGIAPQRVDTAIKLYMCAQALRKRQDGAYLTYGNDYNATLSAITNDALARGAAWPMAVVNDWELE